MKIKWIILALLVACGKNQEPAPVDYGDSDGDQVLNYEESTEGKYLANLDEMGLVEAKLKFMAGEPLEIKLKNTLSGTPLDMIVSSEKKLEAKPYFSEWSDLRLISDQGCRELNKSKYSVQLEFSKESDVPDEVFLRRGKDFQTLGTWKGVMRFEISSEELKEILCGKANLSLKKKFRRGRFFETSSDETIREKTYRVHFFDGKSGRILYVSKDLAFNDLHKKLKISPLKLKSEDDLFYFSRTPGHTGWYAREFSNGEKALVYAEDSIIREKFFNQYHISKAILSRTNGESEKIIELKNKSSANIFLRVRPVSMVKRAFVETREPRTHGWSGGGMNGFGGDSWECVHYIRKIQTEKESIPEYSTFLENLNLEVSESDLGIEQIDDLGAFWEMKLGGEQENTRIFLKMKGEESFSITGEYQNSCPNSRINRGRSPSFRTNIETHLKFQVESFVEKIN
jgi:hypothetical protein